MIYKKNNDGRDADKLRPIFKKLAAKRKSVEVNEYISFIMMLIAIASTVITYTVYRSNSDPEVIVFADLDKRRSGIIILKIKNIGKGPAVNISFKTNKPLPKNAFNSESKIEIMDDGPLINGVSYLAPNQELIITWGQYGGLKKSLGVGSIDVTSHFKRPKRIRPLSGTLSSISKLDITQFESSDASDHNWDAKLVEQAKTSNKHLAKITKVLEASHDGS